MDPEVAQNELGKIAGEHNVSGPAEASVYRVGGYSPAVCAVFPESIEAVQEVVRFCASQSLKIIPLGNGTKSHLCAKPGVYDVALITTRLNSITDYQKDDLVISAQAGVSGSVLSATLKEQNQILTLDPCGFDHSTVGGITAMRSSGPARFAHGTTRDNILGLVLVNAEGNVVHAGGKVVKNVSGYDLCKLYTGSMGTLGIIVEAFYKVSPIPRYSQAMICALPNWTSCEALLTKIMDSHLLPRSREAMNTESAKRLGIEAPDNGIVFVVVFDGTKEQVDYQESLLHGFYKDTAAVDLGKQDCSWWSDSHRKLSDLDLLNGNESLLLIKTLASETSSCAKTAEDIGDELGLKLRVMSHAGNGILRIVVPSADGETIGVFVQKLAATLEPQKASLSCYQSGSAIPTEETWLSKPAGLNLMRAIKAQLDPEGVFPSGRFVGGI